MWIATAVVLALGTAAALIVAFVPNWNRITPGPIVETDAGAIQGLRADDGDYSMFLGVPYAYVEDNNPFGASVPQPRFETVFEAFNDSAICPQVEEFENTIVGSLDCLHLNIFVPNSASSDNKLPVLVWIYGGGFSIGFANRFLYGPKFLVRHDVILVTLNYRVGPYGFFCLDTPEVPGNQGLKDQLLALRWIKRNIGYFDGDDNKITLMGESAGGASIELHLFSEREMLYNQVILQSGSIFIPGIVSESNAEQPLRVAAHLGFVTENLSEALAFLARTDVGLVIGASSELRISSRPCVEKEFENVENILTDYPVNLDVPKARNVSVLVGFNNMESMVSYALMAAENFRYLNVFESFTQNAFNYDDELAEMEKIVKRFYIGDEEMSEALRWKLSDFQSDYTFNFPTYLSMKKYLETGARNIFFYMFSYSGDRNFVKNRLNITDDGAAHADEISYLFDLSYETDPPSAEDQRVIDQMTTLWTNFVKYGEPTPETSNLLPVKWTPISEDAYTYLDIGSELTLGRRPYHRRMAFWDLFYDVNKRKLKGYREN